MPKFYTCRAVVDPSSGLPSVRLCLKPTADGLNCAAHSGYGHGVSMQKSAAVPVIPVTTPIPSDDVGAAAAAEVEKAPGASTSHAPICRRCELPVELNEKGYCDPCFARLPYWPE